MRDEQQTVGSEIAKILRANLLPNLVAILESFPALRSILRQVLQLALVIDANVVCSELRWHLKSRPRSELRSSLEEVSASCVLIAYEPHHLDDEIQEHMEEIALDTKRPPKKWNGNGRLFVPIFISTPDARIDGESRIRNILVLLRCRVKQANANYDHSIRVHSVLVHSWRNVEQRSKSRRS